MVTCNLVAPDLNAFFRAANMVAGQMDEPMEMQEHVHQQYAPANLLPPSKRVVATLCPPTSPLQEL